MLLESYSVTKFDKTKEMIFKPGAMNTIVIEKRIGSKSSAETIDMYQPEKIAMTNGEELKEINKDEDITIEWEPDPLNDNPLALAIIARNFSTDDIENEFINFNPNILSEAIVDDGSYTVPSTFFSQIPSDAEIDIVLVRGHYEEFEDQVVSMGSSDLINSSFEENEIPR